MTVTILNRQIRDTAVPLMSQVSFTSKSFTKRTCVAFCHSLKAKRFCVFVCMLSFVEQIHHWEKRRNT